ncbi:MAG: type IV secretion system DNA-binding domain-containing protein [Candidatus Portnoybacteria bacterium]|nr:type IV secretion system DNA-binding domain-containing protein [Candidatus Portnoybacteria bacterium]
MNGEDITLFAETNFRNQKVKFGIKVQDRRKHFYIIGKTGMGKTTLLENMAAQDIQSGRGIGIVDPHGEFAEKMLDFIPSSRVNDVIYFNPADLDFPIAFNVIEKVDPEHRHLVASGLVGVFKKMWAETWGPRLEYVLRNAILALLEYPGSTLLGIMRMLTDKEYRKKVIDKITDPVVKSFWVDEFAKYPDRFMAEAVAPIQNKVGQFLTSPIIRNIVGQTKSAINIREAMDSRKILIMNLSKGRLGEDNSALLGAMLITRLQLAAMSRVEIPEEERKDFYLYVDEFQNFATESFANILSEARKYRLNLILAHQYITQMVEEVSNAVFGNVGTMVIFRVGAADAEFLEKEFNPEFTANDLVGLGFASIYLKLMIDGLASRPFSAATLPPILKPEVSHREKIIKVSRERYSTDRSEVEEKIAKWSGVIEGEKEERKRFAEESESQRRPAENQMPTYRSKCYKCGKEVHLIFKPDGVRPVYCKECLNELRQEPTEGPKPKARPFNQAPLGRQQEETIRPAMPQKPEPRTEKHSNILVKETGQPISLSEAIKKSPAKFSEPRKKRKEVDLPELRKTLEEALGPEKLDVEKGISKPEVRREEEKSNETDSGKALKPGETVEL